MARNRAGEGIEELLRVIHARGADGQTDGQLLAQFLACRDEAAFAALVKRHGPMVLGVCRRILGNSADAEDAFQAAFLVLVRKAAELTSRAVLGDWLHGVARRTALNAKRAAAIRRVKEEAMARPESQGEEMRDDRLAFLDEALSRLPEKYRLALVLCELEGCTRREAAERLGWPEGTVAGRLARGRALLTKKLLRQGLGIATGTGETGIFPEAAPACMPASLASSTIKAAASLAAGQATTTGAISAPAAALTEGVLKNMSLSKFKIVTAVLSVAVLIAAGGTASVVAYLAGGEKPEIAQQPAAPKRDQEKLKKPQRNIQVPIASEKKPPAPEETDKEDRIRPGDVLKIIASGTPGKDDIKGLYLVEASGKVALGPGYGRVNIKGLTLEEAEDAIRSHLLQMIQTPGAFVTRPIPDNPALERRVQLLESEVRELRSLVEELRKKARLPSDQRP